MAHFFIATPGGAGALADRRLQHACAIYYPEGSGREPVAELFATGERLPLAEYARRWPHHPTLKAYLGDPDGWCIMGEV